MSAEGQNKKQYGFQLQMIAYTLISMALTALTLLVLGLAVYGMLVLVQGEPETTPILEKNYSSYYLNRTELMGEAGGADAGANVVMADDDVGLGFSMGKPGGHELKKGTFFALGGLVVVL
ncbi:MAG: hypothetical protein K2O03_14515, partial [Lachnospiraceae bacterium]|nr:hypothetical protein [Lachnospiraceae bacterium]